MGDPNPGSDYYGQAIPDGAGGQASLRVNWTPASGVITSVVTQNDSGLPVRVWFKSPSFPAGAYAPASGFVPAHTGPATIPLAAVNNAGITRNTDVQELRIEWSGFVGW